MGPADDAPAESAGSRFELGAEGSTAQTLSGLLGQALQSEAASAVLSAYLEGRGVTSGTWRAELTAPPSFRLVRLED